MVLAAAALACGMVCSARCVERVGQVFVCRSDTILTDMSYQPPTASPCAPCVLQDDLAAFGWTAAAASLVGTNGCILP